MSLKRNIINLFASQSISYLIPLLQFPYLTRVLGVDGFGLYVFSYSIILFLMVITNYGFEIYLPKEMAENHGKKDLSNEYFTQSVIIRTGLFLLCMLILFLIYRMTDHYVGRENLLCLVALAVFFNAYSFLWFFQGKESIYYYSRISVSIKLLSVAFIFVFVHRPEDIDKVLLILALSNFFILAISLYVARNRYELKFCAVTAQEVLSLTKGAFEYFVSRLGVSMYATIGGLVVGALSGSLAQVAIYGAAHQLYSAGIYAMSAITTPLIPYMARTKNYAVFFKITVLSLLIAICGASVGWLFGEDILKMIYGEGLIEAKPVLDVFMVTIIISVLGIHFGYPALIPLGKARAANLSVIYAGLGQLSMIAFIMVFNISVTAVVIALTYLVCDLIMTSYRSIVFVKFYEKD